MPSLLMNATTPPSNLTFVHLSDIHFVKDFREKATIGANVATMSFLERLLAATLSWRTIR